MRPLVRVRLLLLQLLLLQLLLAEAGGVVNSITLTGGTWSGVSGCTGTTAEGKETACGAADVVVCVVDGGVCCGLKDCFWVSRFDDIPCLD